MRQGRCAQQASTSASHQAPRARTVIPQELGPLPAAGPVRKVQMQRGHNHRKNPTLSVTHGTVQIQALKAATPAPRAAAPAPPLLTGREERCYRGGRALQPFPPPLA